MFLVSSMRVAQPHQVLELCGVQAQARQHVELSTMGGNDGAIAQYQYL
jgi:hypothetical protein